ncbi:MAG: endolytic transglycosylase MltG [Gammaproteobacteria bacterium]
MARHGQVVGFILILGLVVMLGMTWMVYRHLHIDPLPITTTQVTVLVKPGDSVSRLADRLVVEGVIDHTQDLVWLARLRGVAEQVRAGEYEILAGTTPAGLLEHLVSGALKQYAFTIVEGMTFWQMMDQIREHTALEHTLLDSDGPAVMARIGYSDQHPEGRFSPDTYYFPRGMRDVEFLQRAYHVQARLLREEWEKRADNLPFKNQDDALILASIIEKETSLDEERERIAGVFVRRLRKNMRLQTDPTVIYGLGESFDGDIRFADLRTDTPYNTYTRLGLPPTPIAMPGRASIRAALHPADGNELYFVATGEGGHHFSSTLEEHNEAVRQYQLKKNQ